MGFPFKKVFLSFLAIVQACKGSCTGDGWLEFEDLNCYKLISTPSSQSDASKLCNSQSMDSVLASIRSEKQQIFITNYVFNESTEMNVWIGGMRNNSTDTFEWQDGSEFEYTNWESGAPTIGEPRKSCLQLQSSLSKSTYGEWRDVGCTIFNLVLCEKPQGWSVDQMRDTILELRKIIQETTNQLNLTGTDVSKLKTDQTTTTTDVTKLKTDVTKIQTSLVPIGFIYIQLPGQSDPKTLWPSLSFTDISSTSGLAGNFLRIVGGSSAAFGTTQSESCPRVTRVDVGAQINFFPESVLLNIGSASEYVFSGGLSDGNIFYYGLRFWTSGSEVKPINTAIRIWKRTA